MDVTPTKYIAPKYVARFRCIGADCEEACCSGWQVTVDAPHYAELERRMSATDEERREFRQKLRPLAEADRDHGKYALIVLQDERRCSFFENDGLCSLQKRYGHESLSDTCAMYPRHIGLVGTRVELTAKVSCPEVARQLLLGDDAMAMVEVPGTMVERRGVNRSMASEPRELYDRVLDSVRAAIMSLLADHRYPFASRLAFVACLADELEPIFHRGSAPTHELAVLRAIEQAGSPATRHKIHQEFSALEAPPAFAADVVLRILRSCARAGDDSFGRLVRRTLGQERGDPSTPALHEDEARRLLSAYEKNRSRCEGAFARRLDGYFSRYAMNHFFQEWYTASPSLAAHVQNLVWRIAVLRFLLLCHPTVAREPFELDESTLDRTAVEVFYKFGRGVEHNSDFLAAVERDFRARAADIAQAMFLAKF